MSILIILLQFILSIFLSYSIGHKSLDYGINKYTHENIVDKVVNHSDQSIRNQRSLFWRSGTNTKKLKDKSLTTMTLLTINQILTNRLKTLSSFIENSSTVTNCEENKLFLISGPQFGNNTNIMISFVHGLWLSKVKGYTFIIPPWMDGIVIKFYDLSVLHNYYCFKSQRETIFDDSNVGLKVSSNEIYLILNLFKRNNLRGSLPQLSKSTINEVSLTFLEIFSALWSKPNKLVIDASLYLIKNKLGGHFNYTSVHRRSFVSQCSKVYSDYHLEGEDFDSSHLPMDYKDWKRVDIITTKHPLCAMETEFIEATQRIHQRQEEIVYIASDRREALSSNNNHDGDGDSGDGDNGEKKKENKKLSNKYVTIYDLPTDIFASIFQSNDLMMQVDMFIAIHSDFFIANPYSSYSFQIEVVRISLDLHSTPTMNRDIYFTDKGIQKTNIWVSKRSIVKVYKKIKSVHRVLSFLPKQKLFDYRISLRNIRLGVSERTTTFFNSLDQTFSSVGGAGGSSSLDGLIRADIAWNKLKNGGWKTIPRQIVFDTQKDQILSSTGDIPTDSYDIIVCGGTLGVFYATALQIMGYKTCIVERAKVEGRKQEWNISKKELDALVRANILSKQEIDSIISIEFNPVRVGFHSSSVYEVSEQDGFELFTNDILNVGVKPDELIRLVKSKYIANHGVIIDQTELSRIDIYKEYSIVTGESLSKVENRLIRLRSRLVIDAMGNASPIVKQIRGPQEPDGICIVVGSCARGYDPSKNTYGDVIYTNSQICKKRTNNQQDGSRDSLSDRRNSMESQLQYFWEAFPAGSDPSDRTTYLFTYIDAKPERPSVSEIFDDYWDLLPLYQGVKPEDLKFLRILHGVFPTYRNSPLQSNFDRILQVGDASGIQSPLSFGGFGSLTRHLQRIITALDEVLQNDFVQSDYLKLINAYQPNLSVGWMFQRSMSVPIDRHPDSKLIVQILANSFSAMNDLGDETIRPFLQDVIQFGPLLNTLVQSAAKDFFTPLRIIPHVGIVAIVDFVYHMVAMAWFTWLAQNKRWSDNDDDSNDKSKNLTPELRFKRNRLLDQWKFGSGLDYNDHE